MQNQSTSMKGFRKLQSSVLIGFDTSMTNIVNELMFLRKDTKYSQNLILDPLAYYIFWHRQNQLE